MLSNIDGLVDHAFLDYQCAPQLSDDLFNFENPTIPNALQVSLELFHRPCFEKIDAYIITHAVKLL